MLSFSMSHPIPEVIRIESDSEFALSDDNDPMVPVTSANDEMRFMSILANADTMNVHEHNFKTGSMSASVPIKWIPGGAYIALHASWARRPVLILENKLAAGGATKTQLLLSRSRAWKAGEQPIDVRGGDRLQFEVMVLERDAAMEGDTPKSMTYVAGARCDIEYYYDNKPARECGRSPLDDDGPLRATPARKLQGAQLLPGHFGTVSSAQQDLAIIDACMTGAPAILRPLATRDVVSFTPVSKVAGADRNNMRREIECVPIERKELIERSIVENPYLRANRKSP